MGAALGKVESVRALVRTLPDEQLSKLHEALLAAGQGGVSDMVLDLAEAEAAGRQAARLALTPLLPLTQPPRHALATLNLPPDTARLFWRDLETYAPAAAEEALMELTRLRADDAVPKLFDDVCLEAAGRVRRGEGALAAASAEDGQTTADLLTLVPVARRAVAQMSGWLGRIGGEEQAQARLAYRDAEAALDGGAPLLLRVLAAHLNDPWLTLRLVSAIADRMSERFLAQSELADVGAILLEDLETRIGAIRRFDPSGGAEAGVAAAAAVVDAVACIAEFELQLPLAKDGPWGAQVSAAKRGLAAAVEGRLREFDAALNTAFPLQPARVAKRFLRSVPALGRDPDPATVERCVGLAAFLEETRAATAGGGFGALRAKVVEQAQERLANYVEELLETAHAPEGELAGRARLFLDAVAPVVGSVDGAAAAEMVRRRAAAA